MSAFSDAGVVDTSVSSEDSTSDIHSDPKKTAEPLSQVGRSHMRIFQRHYSVLVSSITSCLNTVANELYSRNIISDEVLSGVLEGCETSQNKASNLLLCVKRNINSNPAVLLKFMNVLKEEPSCDGITKKITSETECQAMA